MTPDRFNQLFPAKPAATTGFDIWMAKVDAILERKIGLSSADLPDWMYCDGYEDGMTPGQAAAAAYRAARDEF